MSLAFGLTAGLAGCGGVAVGVDLGYGGLYYEDYDSPPSVSITASATSVRVGEVVRLVAAASDDDRVESVTFYQVDTNGQAYVLRTFTSGPLTLDVQAAPVPGGVTAFMARARDSAGQVSDSRYVSVAVLP